MPAHAARSLCCMKALLLVLAALLLSPLESEARAYSPEELEGLLAPVALQPDPVLWNILEASTTPNEVIDAAAGRGAHTPAVEALLPYPELLSRMAESPQWLFDLGSAYLGQRNDVLGAVQTLRFRAQAGGHLQSDDVQVVQNHGSAIAVVPAVPNYFVVRYYNPLVVYGHAWRPVHHVHWRPWAPRRAVVHRPVVVHKPVVVHNPVVVHRHAQAHGSRNGPPSPAARMQHQQAQQFRQYHRVPESKRQPIVQPRATSRFEARPSGAGGSRGTYGGTRSPQRHSGPAARP
jgi:hypothetical protein